MPIVPQLLGKEQESLASSNGSLLTARIGSDVLLVVSDHHGHGFFAMVERVANQLLFARHTGLVPFVYVGELVFAAVSGCEFGPQPYFSSTHGDNVSGFNP